jgi:PPP family 3-phenylpropionic acid transporter
VAQNPQIFRGRNQARGPAIYTSLGYGLGGTIGTIMAGFSWETLGAGWTFTFAALAALLALIVVASKPISLPPRSAL